MPIPGWLKEGGKWGAATVGGAVATLLVTLMITSYIERPRPSAEITQIKITTSDSDSAKENLRRLVSVPLSEDLFSELAQSAWTEAFRDPSDDLPKVIAKLNRNREYVDAYLRHAQSYLQLKREMTLLLNGERSAKAAENFFDDWQQVDGFIYGSVRSQMRYGSSALQLLKCQQDTSASHLRKLTYREDPAVVQFMDNMRSLWQHVPGTAELREPIGNEEISTVGQESTKPATSDEHIYSVTKIGGRYKSRFDIRSNLDENEIVTHNEEECAQSVMAALADFDKEKLNAILDLTDQEAKSIELHKKIQSDLEKFIQGYSFWKVSILMTNKGKNPISFSPNATLYVDMSNTTINSGSNLAINLQIMSRNGESDTITVPGGESRSVSFISSDLVKDYGDWKSMIDVFGQSSRNCVVVLYPQTGDKMMLSTIRSFGPPAKGSPMEAQIVSENFRR